MTGFRLNRILYCDTDTFACCDYGGKMFFEKKKKENKIEEFNYVGFTTWLNKVLQSPLPENTKAINFNLYEEAQPNTFGIQFVATSSFELNNDDWACDEILSSNGNMFFFCQ